MIAGQRTVYDELGRYCTICGAELEVKATGRPRRTCSERCRQRASRNRRRRVATATFRDGAVVVRGGEISVDRNDPDAEAAWVDGHLDVWLEEQGVPADVVRGRRLTP